MTTSIRSLRELRPVFSVPLLLRVQWEFAGQPPSTTVFVLSGGWEGRGYAPIYEAITMLDCISEAALSEARGFVI